MGSAPFLSSFDGGVLSNQLEASYCVPVFWLALFEPHDLHDEPIAEARFATGTRVFAIDAPYLLARTEPAKARFERRSPALARLCTPAHAPLVAMLDDRDADPERYHVGPLTVMWADRDWQDSDYAEALVAGA